MRYKFRTYNYDPTHVSCSDFAKLRIAAKVALSSNHHKFRLGAAVVKSGRVLSYSPNIPRKGPDTPPFRESIHAEVAAMKGVKKIEGATIYVARLNSTNKLALSMPCEYCVEHMIACGIDRVVFSVSQNEARSYYLDSIVWEENEKGSCESQQSF